MVRPVYFGIEQEYCTLRPVHHHFLDLLGEKYWRSIDFDTVMGHVDDPEHNSKYYRKSDTARRTKTGSGFYCDCETAEICTPPVRIDVSRFTNDLETVIKASRNELAEYLKGNDIRLFGYSTHLNISSHIIRNLQSKRAIQETAVPLGMFLMTPNTRRYTWSTLRSHDNHSDRAEIQGDYIHSIDQLKSAAIILTALTARFTNIKTKVDIEAYSEFNDSEEYSPDFDHFGIWRTEENPFFSILKSSSGRNTEVPLVTGEIITAQECLERVLYEVRKGINMFPRNDRVTLDGFVKGNTELEIDKTEFYQKVGEKIDEEGFPIDEFPEELTLSTSDLKHKFGELPLLAQFYGNLVKGRLGVNPHKTTGKQISLIDMNWNEISFESRQNGSEQFFTIRHVENLDYLAYLMSKLDNERDVLKLTEKLLPWLEYLPVSQIYNMMSPYYQHEAMTPSDRYVYEKIRSEGLEWEHGFEKIICRALPEQVFSAMQSFPGDDK